MTQRFPAWSFFFVSVVRFAPFPIPARRTVHAVLPHTAHRRRSPPGIRCHPPGPERPGCSNNSVKADQPEVIRWLEEHHRTTEGTGPLVPFADHQHQAHPHISLDLVEVPCGVAVAE